MDEDTSLDRGRGDLGIRCVQGSVQHVTGHVVGSRRTFAGHLVVGDAADAFTGSRLLNPFGAEMHLIVRDHAVASPDIITDQFNNDSPRFCTVAASRFRRSVHLARQ